MTLSVGWRYQPALRGSVRARTIVTDYSSSFARADIEHYALDFSIVRYTTIMSSAQICGTRPRHFLERRRNDIPPLLPTHRPPDAPNIRGMFGASGGRCVGRSVRKRFDMCVVPQSKNAGFRTTDFRRGSIFVVLFSQ